MSNTGLGPILDILYATAATTKTTTTNNNKNDNTIELILNSNLKQHPKV